jgi:hypothetical protein
MQTRVEDRVNKARWNNSNRGDAAHFAFPDEEQ